MNLKQTRLHILEKQKNLGTAAKAGVSMHCHTLHSRELLDFLPYYAEKIPVVSYFWKRENRRYFEREGKELPDISNGFWSPPLPADEVFRSEKDQINSVGLDAMVSITDHDCIDANLALNAAQPNSNAPISMEWTVPFQYAFFHVGVHNLPPQRAAEITMHLLAYSDSPGDPDNARLHELFGLLNEIPEVLIVLNHPVWDIEMIGEALHIESLEDFVNEHGHSLHAFEINGFRSWSENMKVIRMANDLGFPLVSGGDRHCCHANTVINLTNAKDFSEFVREVRVDGYSEVVLMPEYREPLASRQLASIAQILGHYPGFPEQRQRWTDRVHIDIKDGSGMRPLSFHWKGGGPKWLRKSMRLIGILGGKTFRPAFRLAMKSEDVVGSESNVQKRFPYVFDQPIPDSHGADYMNSLSIQTKKSEAIP